MFSVITVENGHSLLSSCSMKSIERLYFSLRKPCSVITKYTLKGCWFCQQSEQQEGRQMLVIGGSSVCAWGETEHWCWCWGGGMWGLTVSPLPHHACVAINCRTIWVIRFSSESGLGHFRLFALFLGYDSFSFDWDKGRMTLAVVRHGDCVLGVAARRDAFSNSVFSWCTWISSCSHHL